MKMNEFLFSLWALVAYMNMMPLTRQGWHAACPHHVTDPFPEPLRTSATRCARSRIDAVRAASASMLAWTRLNLLAYSGSCANVASTDGSICAAEALRARSASSVAVWRRCKARRLSASDSADGGVVLSADAFSAIEVTVNVNVCVAWPRGRARVFYLHVCACVLIVPPKE